MTEQATRLLTHIPGLDAVLGGGFTSSDLIFIIGAPGAGKTVLGSQLIFTAARSGLPCLIMTTYSEGHVKLMEHISSFTFYDEMLISRSITLLTLQTLISAEPAAAAATIARTIRDSGAKLVLIDGFQGIAALLSEPESSRRLLAALSSQLSYLKTTLIVTLTGDARDQVFYPELTTSDCIMSLTYTLEARQHRRLLEIVKRRGHAQLPGQHSYLIDSSGITVLPRLEVYPQPANYPRPSGRICFGLPELDKVLGGGLNAGTNSILAGAPGTGKTVLALSWALNDAHPDAKTVYFTFREHAEQLEAKAAAFGLDLRAAIESGALALIRLDPVELNPDVVAQHFVAALIGTSTRRFIIDDLNVLIKILGTRAHDYFTALVRHLYGEGITSLTLLEITPFTGFQLDLTDVPVGVLGENVVMIQQHEIRGVLRRILAVLRMRFSDYDRTIRELVLDTQGIRVLTAENTSAGTLDAAAAASGGVAPTSQQADAKARPAE